MSEVPYSTTVVLSHISVAWISLALYGYINETPIFFFRICVLQGGPKKEAIVSTAISAGENLKVKVLLIL